MIYLFIILLSFLACTICQWKNLFFYFWTLDLTSSKQKTKFRWINLFYLRRQIFKKYGFFVIQPKILHIFFLFSALVDEFFCFVYNTTSSLKKINMYLYEPIIKMSKLQWYFNSFYSSYNELKSGRSLKPARMFQIQLFHLFHQVHSSKSICALFAYLPCKQL